MCTDEYSCPMLTTTVATIPPGARRDVRGSQEGYRERWVSSLLSKNRAANLATENWDVKGKFPPALKPVLVKIALKAILLGEYNENFFNLMPRIFPYNRFTMFVSVESTHTRVRNTERTVEINQAHCLASAYGFAAGTSERARRGAT